ncbi:hypothetical protein MNBD_ACTINO02-1659 [hydrothermal vent metagenome]|uniref:Carbonic anhydrase n=1 Tax=hydrothermal vent metagenome TaxID=652676 RepID=A0A3B0TQ09_9ZZZZ
MTHSWLDDIAAANRSFRDRIRPQRLMTDGPSGRGVITCKDPRVNLAAIGVRAFGEDGFQDSHVAIIRTAGARVDERSLLVAVFLADVTELLVLGHTDCGVKKAHDEIQKIRAQMEARLTPQALAAFHDEVGDSSDDLRSWIKTFTDPRAAVRDEIAHIRSLSFAPSDLLIHGAVYDVATGAVSVVT